MVAAQQIYPKGMDVQYNFPPAILKLDPNSNASGANNTPVVLTYDADPNSCNVVRQIFFSYTANPVGGSLQIEDGPGNVVFGPLELANAGAGSITFDPPLCGSRNTQLRITLAGGGGTTDGFLYAVVYKLL